MRSFRGRVAVVTGAASGIGKALSEALAARGCDLALVDRDTPGLAALEGVLAPTCRAVSLHTADVADRARMAALPEEVLAVHRGVHLLVNNAGVSVAAPVEQASLDDLDWVMATNFWGTVYGCKFFLPHLRRQPEAH